MREHIVNAVKTAKRGGRGFGASSSGATSAAATGKAEGAVEEEQAEAALLEQTSAPSTANTAEAKNIIAEFDALIENIKACLDGNYPAEGDTAAQDGESDVKFETADGDDAPVVPATDNSVQPMTRNGKKAPVKKGKSAPKKKKARMSYSDEEGDDDGEDAENDADDDDDEQDEEADTENTVNRGKPSNRGASKVSTAKAKKNEPAPAKSGRTGRLKKTSQIALGDDSD